MKNNKAERGQVLILIVLGFVLILGFAGLAIDGGRVYSDRRNGQNGADAASLAGGGEVAMYLEENVITSKQWDCPGVPLQTAMRSGINVAIVRAQSNDFTIDNDYDADWNGVEARCYTKSFAAGLMVDRYIDVIARITTHTKPVFIQFFYPDVVNSQVEAVTRVRPIQPFGFGQAIIALNRLPCSGTSNGVILSGSLDASIKGGGVFSNGCLKGNGGYDAMIQDGGVSYVGEQQGGMNYVDENGQPITVQQVDTPMPSDAVSIPVPNCNPPAITMKDIRSSRNLAPGLYCLTGDPHNSNWEAIKLSGSDKLTGIGVTIYVMSGGVDIAGSVTLNLQAPDASAVNNAVPGLLFYVASVGKEINIQGNGGTQVEGLIYAPDATVTLAGTPGVVSKFNTQIVAQNVMLTGNAVLDVVFDDAKNYNSPTRMELAK